MKNAGLILLIIGLIITLPACSDDDDNDVLDGHTIEATPNDPEYGSVTGAGVYEDGQTVILTATPEEGYIFMFWSENEEMVHDDNVYEFVATEDRTLVAHFSDQADPDAGFFSVEITGDVEWSFEGFAFFGEVTDPDTEQDLFIVVLRDGQANATLSFIKGGEQPGTGEISIGNIDVDDVEGDFVFPEDHFLATMINAAGAEFYIFASDGGGMNISESSVDAFAGSFQYQATGVLVTQPMNELEVNVEGTFSAIFGDVDAPGL